MPSTVNLQLDYTSLVRNAHTAVIKMSLQKRKWPEVICGIANVIDTAFSPKELEQKAAL